MQIQHYHPIQNYNPASKIHRDAFKELLKLSDKVPGYYLNKFQLKEIQAIQALVQSIPQQYWYSSLEATLAYERLISNIEKAIGLLEKISRNAVF